MSANDDERQNVEPDGLCQEAGARCAYTEEIHRLRDEVANLAELAKCDELTGLYNFRFFRDCLTMEMERARRTGQPVSLILCDVDHFKTFNDRWGHDMGNKALVHIAGLIKLAIRKLDIPCRFGGEEFVIILPGTDLRKAVSVADRLRSAIEATPLVSEQSASRSMTVSMGVDSYCSYNNDTFDVFLQRTDAWLYRAKNTGRNCLAHPPVEESAITVSVTAEEKDALFGR